MKERSFEYGSFSCTETGVTVRPPSIVHRNLLNACTQKHKDALEKIKRLALEDQKK